LSAPFLPFPRFRAWASLVNHRFRLGFPPRHAGRSDLPRVHASLDLPNPRLARYLGAWPANSGRKRSTTWSGLRHSSPCSSRFRSRACRARLRRRLIRRRSRTRRPAAWMSSRDRRRRSPPLNFAGETSVPGHPFPM